MGGTSTTVDARRAGEAGATEMPQRTLKERMASAASALTLLPDESLPTATRNPPTE
jgi:hypothetical protein